MYMKIRNIAENILLGCMLCFILYISFVWMRISGALYEPLPTL